MIPGGKRTADNSSVPANSLPAQPGMRQYSQLPYVPETGNTMQERNNQLMPEQAFSEIQTAMLRIQDFVTQRYLSDLGRLSAQEYKPNLKTCVFRICELVYDTNEDIYEKLASIYSSMNMCKASVAMVLQGTATGCIIYMAVSNIVEYEGDLLKANILGQFPGTRLQVEANPTKLLGAGSAKGFLQTVSFVPARRANELNHGGIISSQGIEKIVDALRGRIYTAIFLANSVTTDELSERRGGYEYLATLISTFVSENVSIAESESASVAHTISESLNESATYAIGQTYGASDSYSKASSRGKNRGTSNTFFGFNFSRGTNTSLTDTNTYSMNSGKTENLTDTTGRTTTDGETATDTTGQTRTISLRRENKSAERLLKLIDSQLKRLDEGASRGMWHACCYVIAPECIDAISGASVIASVLSGDRENPLPVYNNRWYKIQDITNMINWLQDLRHPEFSIDGGGGNAIKVTPAVLISGMEMPGFMPLPRKSTSDVNVITMAEFARSISYNIAYPRRPDFTFGRIMHMGQPENGELPFSWQTFSSHTFITGSSGSGKSNTTYHLLDMLYAKKIPFMVIEPVKGEYKEKFGGYSGVNIFTTMSDSYRMLRINPFAFPPRYSLLEHLGRLVDTISACWPLYGPMPDMLKSAFELAYKRCGWDLLISEQVQVGPKKYPTFADLAVATEEIIREAGYSAQATSDYKGALLTRIRSLTNGFEGQIFCGDDYIPDSTLFDTNAIIDLSRLGSPETRSLIMGILIIKLREYRIWQHLEPDSPTRHITVLEEAHNILKRCSYERGQDSANAQGHAVASLCDCIAEMRTYGEGFMIIDQSPSKVDDAAMRNTAIKVVMRLQYQDDMEAIASTMGLSQEQTSELGRLGQGMAVVMQSTWHRPVMARMGERWKPQYPCMTQPIAPDDMKRVLGMVSAFVFKAHKDGTLATCRLRNDIDEMLSNLINMYDKYSRFKGLSMGRASDILNRCDTFNAIYRKLAQSAERDVPARLDALTAQFIIEINQAKNLAELIPLNMKEKDGLTINVSQGKDRECFAWWSSYCKAFKYYMLIPYFDGDSFDWPAQEHGLLVKIRECVLRELLVPLTTGGPQIMEYMYLNDYLHRKKLL